MTPDAPAAASPAVLLLEDRGEVRAVVAAMLKRRGVDCDAAASLAEARGLLACRRYDILIVDVNLPDGRGLSVLAPGPDAPLAVVMTGDRSDAAGREALDAGAVEVIAKPFGVNEFLRHFDAVFERWRVRWNHGGRGAVPPPAGGSPGRDCPPAPPEDPAAGG